jgi:hypothetical protein
VNLPSKTNLLGLVRTNTNRSELTQELGVKSSILAACAHIEVAPEWGLLLIPPASQIRIRKPVQLQEKEKEED